ncbi:RNA polymerase-associated protein [Psilocybe cubensis]|uniref:Plus3 domain-containing protein n=2 Tax=Psilocybe cubensis TaxID=181762 RepID=A0A8H8CGT6_PSICU|nr:RNA polymerase-associated protein [Psilocybe cubensis]KAH9474656.1 RNA polymerase-associated protein [Psilocybe cubensis]
MSDFEDDIDDQLLELAGATEKKKKRRQQHSTGSAGSGKGSGGKSLKRKERMDSDSENDVESEDDMQDPYPLEGKYKDEADKRELLAMTEFQREQVLEERAGERQRIQNARMLADLVRQQRGGSGDDSVSRAAKRQHTQRGATKEKSNKLDELKAKRKAKDDKKRSKVNGSPSQRERSSSPQDMEISASESEDGQITKTEQEEERLMNAYDSQRNRRTSSKEDSADTPCNMSDLESCRLSRDVLAKHCLKPWFQDYVTGAWVRYLIGQENGQPVYRICQINNLASDLVKPYKINEVTTNQAFELKHGKSIRSFNMDKVSNGPFVDKEYDRLKKVCQAEDVKLPTKLALEKKIAQMQRLVSQPMTEADITAMLQRKAQLQGNKNAGLSTLERSTLLQKRTLAERRHDYAEVAEIEAQLAQHAANTPEPVRNDNTADLLAKVNERNRKANMESVRKAELQEAERKRRERKLAQSGAISAPIDPSARLKITPRTFNSNTPTGTRPGTPAAPAEKNGAGAAAILNAATAGKAPVKGTSSFEASLIDSVEIDLGDF